MVLGMEMHLLVVNKGVCDKIIIAMLKLNIMLIKAYLFVQGIVLKSVLLNMARSL